MGKKNIKTALTVSILVIFLVFSASAMAAEKSPIVGKWKITSTGEGQGRMMGGGGSFIITQDKAGKLTGKWGNTAVTNLKFADNKLSFTRTMNWGDRDMTSDFSGTLKDGKIIGNISAMDNDTPVKCIKVLPLCDAVGTWDMTTTMGERTIESKVIINQDVNGVMSGSWENEYGKSKITDIKVKEGKLTLKRSVEFNDQTMDFNFEGTISKNANEITGKTTGGMGDMEMDVKGKRVNAALIGVWVLDTSSDMGDRKALLTIEKNLTGEYDMGFFQMPVSKLKLAGEKLTFEMNMGSGERAFSMDFEGTLKDGTLKGVMYSDYNDTDVTGKKLKAGEKAPELSTSFN